MITLFEHKCIICGKELSGAQLCTCQLTDPHTILKQDFCTECGIFYPSGKFHTCNTIKSKLHQKKGILIVIEGTDSSGKETQTKKLHKALKKLELNSKKISFPNYDSDASAPVKMYLAGKFGEVAGKVNPYPISTMYAIDRYASFKEDWGKDYAEGKIIISDRYTTSNIVHQAAKLEASEKDDYITWLEDLEYNKMELPKPDLVLFLNMPTEKACALMETRNNKITGGEAKDIHEKDEAYLKKAHTNACEVAKKLGWVEIMCATATELKTKKQIHKEILKTVMEVLKNGKI